MAVTECNYGQGMGGEPTRKFAQLTSGTWAGNQPLTVTGLAHKPVGYCIWMSDGTAFATYGDTGGMCYMSSSSQGINTGFNISYQDDGFTINNSYGSSNYTYKGYYFYDE